MFGNRRRPLTPPPDGEFTPAAMFTTVSGIEIGLSRQPANDGHPPTWSVSAYAAGTWWTGQRDQLDDAQELAGALGPVLRRLEDAAGLANLAAHRARELLAGDQGDQRRPPPRPIPVRAAPTTGPDTLPWPGATGPVAMPSSSIRSRPRPHHRHGTPPRHDHDDPAAVVADTDRKAHLLPWMTTR